MTGRRYTKQKTKTAAEAATKGAGARTIEDGARRATGRSRATNRQPARTRTRPKQASKTSLLIERLSRPDGAGIAELTEALGWLPHTVRAALTGLRRNGYVITRTKSDDGQSIYRVAAPVAEREQKGRSAKRAA